MKCTKCQAVIKDGLTTCPYCGNNLEETKSVLPETPDKPVLPEDQGLLVEKSEPAQVIETEETKDIKEPVTSALETNTATITIPGEENLNVATPNEEVDTSNLTNNSLMPDGNIGEPSPLPTPGEKIDHIETPKEGKKGKSRKLLVMLIVVLVIVGIGGFIYYYEYQTANKRMTTFIDNMFSSTKNYSNDIITKSSGSYNVDGSLTIDDANYQATFDGTYAYDLSKKIADIKLNVSKLNIEGQDLIPSPLNLETYINDKKAYILVSNFYDKYISTDIDTESMVNTKENVNYQLIISNLKSILITSLNNTNKTQTVKKVKLDNKEEMVNIVTIKLTEANVRTIYQTFKSRVSNNQTLLEELSKLTNTSVDEIKSSIEKSEFKYNLNPSDYIELYTDLFKPDFKGLRISFKNENKTNKIEFWPNNGGYKINFNDEDKNDVKVSYSGKKTTDAKVISNNYSYNIDFKVGDKSVKASLNVKTSIDRTPNVTEVNVKNSVDYSNIPYTDIIGIQGKLKGYGTLGTMISGLLTPQEIPSEIPTNNQTTNTTTPTDNTLSQ